ncbi:hypothetical protein OSTOST_00836 [Ostertagia ostertagi]
MPHVVLFTTRLFSFRGSSSGASTCAHSTAVPIATYAAPIIQQGPAGHTVSTYQTALNLPIDQYDLHHFDPGVPLLNSGADDLSSSSSQLMFNRKDDGRQEYSRHT